MKSHLQWCMCTENRTRRWEERENYSRSSKITIHHQLAPLYFCTRTGLTSFSTTAWSYDRDAMRHIDRLKIKVNKKKPKKKMKKTKHIWNFYEYKKTTPKNYKAKKKKIEEKNQHLFFLFLFQKFSISILTDFSVWKDCQIWRTHRKKFKYIKRQMYADIYNAYIEIKPYIYIHWCKRYI